MGNRVLEYIRLRPGRGFKPIRATLYYSQCVVVHEGLRSAITACIVAIINLLHSRTRARRGSDAVSRESATLLASLNAAGIARLPSLRPEQVKEINEYLSDKPLALRNGDRSLRDLVPPETTI